MCWNWKGLESMRLGAKALLIQGPFLLMTGPVSWGLVFLIWKMTVRVILDTQNLWWVLSEG